MEKNHLAREKSEMPIEGRFLGRIFKNIKCYRDKRIELGTLLKAEARLQRS